MRNTLIILFFIFISINSFSQIINEQNLAEQYFQQGEFDKAVTIYEKLYTQNPSLHYLYKNYINTLLELNDFNKAEKVIKKQIKREPERLTYLIDMGNVYAQSGNQNKAKTQYEKVINTLSSNENQIRLTASGFWSINEFNYAIETYKKGRKLLRDKNEFSYELGKLYAKIHDTPKMINTYLDLLQYNPRQGQIIKNTLQDELESDKDYKELRSQLYKRIQKNPNNAIFVDFLVWLLIQQNDFEAAFLQTKALHKRLNENGRRIISFARVTANNKYYDIAIKAYQYIIDEDLHYYTITAEMGMLDAKKNKIIESGNYTHDDITILQKDYEQFLNKYGKNPNTVTTLKELAHLEAYYLHDLKKAIDILEEIVNDRMYDKHFQSEAKLDLGDIYLLKGEIWEAMLLYMQVDKSYKDEPIGDEAKFRIAKLSYYNGDFEWAQNQLNILKASTSKLIANDALKLSIFLIDNMGLDTNTVPLKMYAQTELLIHQNKFEEALQGLDAIVIAYSDHALSDDILFTKAKIKMKQKEYDEAATFLQEVVDNYSYDILGDDALFTLAELYQYNLMQNEKAQELYQELLIKYTDSIFSVEARKRFRQLRGDNIN